VKKLKYIICAAVTLVVCAVIAVRYIPYGGDNYGDGYFAFARTCVLAFHYVFHTGFLVLHTFLISKKSKATLWLLLSITAHVFLTLQSIHLSVFFWTYI